MSIQQKKGTPKINIQSQLSNLLQVQLEAFSAHQ